MSHAFEWSNAPAAQFAVIGDPVGHSLSPRMQNAAFEELDLPYRYVAIHVRTGEVSDALDHLRDLGYLGVNVTLPHKQEALAWLDTADEFVQRVQSVNCIDLRKKHGYNTDSPGFLDTLKRLAVQKVLMLGAGGSARALASGLVDAGYDLKIYNRTKEKAVNLIEELKLNSVPVLETPDLTDIDLVVNTTSATAHGERLEIDWSHASPSLIAYELMYGKPSSFLDEANSHDLRTIDGLEMLICQGARSFQFWLGRPAPIAVMREAVR